MVASPTDFAVMRPDDASIVAMDIFDEDHSPSPSELSNVVDPFEHIVCVPLKSPALTGKVIVTVLVSIASAQPPEPVTVYVIVASPADWAVMSPVDAFIVATSVSDENHVPEPPFELNVVVLVEHISCVPLNVPAFGAAVIVTMRVAVALGQASSPATV